MPKNRKKVLLRACFDMLRKCEDARFVISPLETEVYYDEADCDGSCLLDDLALELGIERQTEPFVAPGAPQGQES